MKVRSVKGEWLDVGLYLAQNEEMIALGNAGLNARGDVLDKRGNVIKTAADIAAEYHAKNPKAVKQISIKDLNSEVLMTPAQAVKAMADQVQTQAPAQAPASAKKAGRKITDSDE